MTLLLRDLGRAVATGANRLGFVKFYSFAVVDIGTEGFFDRIDVGVQGIGR